MQMICYLNQTSSFRPDMQKIVPFLFKGGTLQEEEHVVQLVVQTP